MSTRLGMDADAVEAVAHQMQVTSRQLDVVIRSIDATVNHALNAWHGPDTAQFHQDWMTNRRPPLTGAASGIDEFVRLLLKNVEDQRTASNTYEGGARSGRVGLPNRLGPGGLFPPLRDLKSVGLGGFVDAIGDASGKVKEMSGLDLFSQTTKSANIIDELGKWAGNAKVIKEFDLNRVPGVNALGALGIGVDAATAAGDFSRGDILHGLTGSVDIAADQLKEVGVQKGSLPTYLVGVVASEGSYITNAAADVDWSPDSVNMTNNYIINNPGVVWEETGKAIVKVGTDLPGIFGW